MVPVLMLPGPIRVDRKVLTTVRCHQDEMMEKKHTDDILSESPLSCGSESLSQ